MYNPPRDWRFYLDDMIAFAERTIAYTESMDQAQFVADELTYHATQRNLQLIGEATTHIPEDVRARHSEIPWRLIIATRDRLMRGHRGIDDDTLWSIIITDVPDLLPKLRALSAMNWVV